MKVVFCKGQVLGPISGADETLVTYATHLKRAGHAVSVLFMYRPPDADPHYLRLLEAGVPVASVAAGLTRSYMRSGREVFHRLLRAAPSMRQLVRSGAQQVVTSVALRHYEKCLRLLKELAPDLIHVVTPDPSAMVMIRAGHDAHIPVLYQELGIPYHPPDFESYYEQFVSVIPLCSEVATLSPGLARQCLSKLPINDLPHILPVMSGGAVNGAERRPGAGVTFGFAARMERLKGPLALMEAFGHAVHGAPDIYLRMAGGGGQQHSVAARAKQLNVEERYQYAGVYTSEEQKSAFMRGLDVFVMPSLSEGTPNCIVEAMAHGKPVIASSVGGIPDMLEGGAGILVPPADPAALAEAIILLARDGELRERMGEVALASYRKLFSPDAVMPVILETYRHVVGHPNGGGAAPAGGSLHPWL